MILFRYITKEILGTFFAVSLILLLIVVSNSLAHFLGRAASGSIDPDVLVYLLLYRIPASLEIIFPLSMFLAVMLSVGRMYMESEVTILYATGTSEKKLAAWVLIPAFVVTAVVGVIAFDLAPRGLNAGHEVTQEQRSRSDVDKVIAGRFMEVKGRHGVVYTEEVADSRLYNVFLASLTAEGAPFVMVSPTAVEEDIEGQRYLVFNDGVRYDFTPGEVGGQIIEFDRNGVLIPERELEQKVGKLKTWSTSSLIEAGEAEHIAMLQYRASITLMVPIMTLLAVSLARTNPRSGKYAKLMPGILLFLLYFVLISASQSAMEDGKLPTAIGMWWIHIAFLGLAWYLLTASERSMRSKKRALA